VVLGAIVGDIVGSRFEFDRGDKTTRFEFFGPGCDFTDDSVMTLAVAQALLDLVGDATGADGVIAAAMRTFYRAHPAPTGGYGGRFARWLADGSAGPYGSFGNGSAMRVSAVGWCFQTLDDTVRWAEITARVTHNHPEGIKGAQATAAAIFLARTQGPGVAAKAHLREFVETTFGYDLGRTLDEIRPGYRHVESCQETVPEALTAYLESDGFEDAVRLAISLGGDTDTLGAITGSVAAAAYGVPQPIRERAIDYLTPDLRAVVGRWETALQGRTALRARSRPA
jgi:ADP-ribosylglycohydrolase